MFGYERKALFIIFCKQYMNVEHNVEHKLNGGIRELHITRPAVVCISQAKLIFMLNYTEFNWKPYIQ